MTAHATYTALSADNDLREVVAHATYIALRCVGTDEAKATAMSATAADMALKDLARRRAAEARA